MSDILEGLNSQQKEAVTHKGTPLLLLAGAGSGKTRVLTHRAAYFIQQKLATPDQILLLTFTNKAAKEMRARLASILGEETMKYMWVGTFHSICGRILRQDIDNFSFPSGISMIIDSKNLCPTFTF
jgi:DNA helicase-2/ATP-dependent DNA helicase PcrA